MPSQPIKPNIDNLKLRLMKYIKNHKFNVHSFLLDNIKQGQTIDRRLTVSSIEHLLITDISTKSFVTKI